jgi:hypothetical protein
VGEHERPLQLSYFSSTFGSSSSSTAASGLRSSFFYTNRYHHKGGVVQPVESMPFNQSANSLKDSSRYLAEHLVGLIYPG